MATFPSLPSSASLMMILHLIMMKKMKNWSDRYHKTAGVRIFNWSDSLFFLMLYFYYLTILFVFQWVIGDKLEGKQWRVDMERHLWDSISMRHWLQYYINTLREKMIICYYYIWSRQARQLYDNLLKHLIILGVCHQL